jgi:hypothetical protein
MEVYAIYAILVKDKEDGCVLLPNYFNSYEDALNEVKRKYPNWDDKEGEDDEDTINEVDVEEGNKFKNSLFKEDDNLTELYIEPGINIHIRKLVVKQTGGYSRKRHRKSNRKSRKHRI